MRSCVLKRVEARARVLREGWSMGTNEGEREREKERKTHQRGRQSEGGSSECANEANVASVDPRVNSGANEEGGTDGRNESARGKRGEVRSEAPDTGLPDHGNGRCRDPICFRALPTPSHPLLHRSLLPESVPSVEQARGIFYTTQDTLLLTCRGEGSLLVVEEKREADDHIGMMCIGIYT